MTGVLIASIRKNKSDEVRIGLERHNGRDLIDVRTHVQLSDPSAGVVATKKGVSLPISDLPALAQALNDAVLEAQRRGLLAKA